MKKCLALALVLCLSLTGCGLKDSYIKHYETVCPICEEAIDVGVMFPRDMFGDQEFAMTPEEFAANMDYQVNQRWENPGAELEAVVYYEGDSYYYVVDRNGKHLITVVLFSKEGYPSPQESQSFQIATLLAREENVDFNRLMLVCFMNALDPSMDDEQIAALLNQLGESDELVLESNGLTFAICPGEDGAAAFHIGAAAR